jgi:hypothetical protein
MEADYRRSIDELIARYTLAPELRDVYVEGSSDKKLYEWFLKQFGCKSVSIFEIDSVNIDNGLITKFGLQSGNRSEVVALSLEFDRSLPHDVRYLLCIADSDFDFLLGKIHTSKYLFYTDYTSVDMYFFGMYILEKFFNLGIPRLNLSCSLAALIKNFVEVLQDIFVIRATNEKCGWNLKWLDFTNCCKIHKELVIFDSSDFIGRYLSKNGCKKRISEFIDIYGKLRSKRVAHYKQKIRGRDYLELVAWYTSKRVGKCGYKYCDPDVIRSMIFPGVDYKILAKEPMFKGLLKKYGS